MDYRLPSPGLAPPCKSYSIEIDESTPLLLPPPQKAMHAPRQKLMTDHNAVYEFRPLERCALARVSECDDGTLKSAVQDLLGLQDARVFHVVNIERDENIFVTKELATFCERNCFPARCRPENTEIYFVPSYEADPILYARMVRPCCGSAAHLTNPQGAELGQIYPGPARCGRISIIVDDAASTRKYTISSSRCAAARWCGKLPFGSCKSVPFTVEVDRRPVAFIRNEWAGIMRECLTDADDYSVDFGVLKSHHDKFLMIAATMFIDSLYFSRMCTNWTLRNLVVNYFNPVSKIAKASKFGRYIPLVMAGARKAHQVMEASKRKPPVPGGRPK